MAIYKRGRGFKLGTTENKASKWPERDSNPGPPDWESDAKTTRPRYFPVVVLVVVVGYAVCKCDIVIQEHMSRLIYYNQISQKITKS